MDNVFFRTIKNKQRVIATLLLIIIIALSGCTQNNTNATDKTLPDPLAEKITQLEGEASTYKQQLNDITNKNSELENQIKALEAVNKQAQSTNNLLLVKAISVMSLIKNKDFTELAKYVHPKEGVRFSPYGFINVQKDLVFSAAELKELLTSTKIYTWGSYDGSGEPIKATFKDYYDKFVYDEDYINPHMLGNNYVIGTGNTINNISQAYANSSFIEFNFAGFDKKYAGLDWSSLRLVFKDVSGTWYLVGIIHDQWTI